MENKHKPRILYVGEFTQLATGYSTYGMEVMKRLHESGKYELGELACYVTQSDERASILPWKVYANHPEHSNRQAIAEYNSKQTNQFGEFSFEDACLQFKPDIVWDIRDWWMMEFEERSPFRSYYKWAIMPTVDAAPQHEQWLATYMNADAVFTYSDWGTEILRQEGGGLINTQGSAPPGADLVTFHPMEKGPLRKKFNFEDDVNIIGTVMRNQGRKLYPELIESFAKFLGQAPSDIAKKTYLYLHTSYPDQGWDIPRLIKKYGVGHKTLVTYKCLRCNAVFPSFFMDATGPCQDCGQPAARMPNVQEGIDRKILAKIINLFDVYVQYANSEGFGMPMVEAASCGIPVFATDYSAMSDVVRKVGGYPIRVDRYKMDNDFGCLRALPDNQDLIDKWIKHFSSSPSERMDKSKKARQGVERHYTWEQTTKKWMTVFDQLTSPKSNMYFRSMGTVPSQLPVQAAVSNGQKTPKNQPPVGSSNLPKRPMNFQRQNTSVTPINKWDSPPQIWTPLPIPREPFETNEDLVRWAISNILGKPELTNSYLSLRLIRDLNWGLSMKNLAGGNYANEQSFITRRSDLKPFRAEDMIQELTLMCEHRNYWENKRWQMIVDSA